MQKHCSYLLEICAYPSSGACYAQLALAGGDVILEKCGSTACGWIWSGRRQMGLVDGDEGSSQKKLYLRWWEGLAPTKSKL